MCYLPRTHGTAPRQWSSGNRGKEQGWPRAARRKSRTACCTSLTCRMLARQGNARQGNAMQWKASEIAYASWRPRPSLYRGADRGTEITHRGGEIWWSSWLLASSYKVVDSGGFLVGIIRSSKDPLVGERMHMPGLTFWHSHLLSLSDLRLVNFTHAHILIRYSTCMPLTLVWYTHCCTVCASILTSAANRLLFQLSSFFGHLANSWQVMLLSEFCLLIILVYVVWSCLHLHHDS